MTVPLYSLCGPQVEPGASFWLQCRILEAVTIDAILEEAGAIRPFTDFEERKEFRELVRLYKRREQPVPKQSRLLTNPIFFERAPAGAVLSTDDEGRALPVSNGVELASLFEGETPGLWHHHVLHVIFDPRVKDGPAQLLSPSRQALVWAALNATIMRALSAAWYLKWLGGPDVEYRRRPSEYFCELPNKPGNFQFLYDLEIDPKPGLNGRITRTNPKTMGPTPNPGTPRHPAYPSGHSTYSAAASALLACLFEGYRDRRPELARFDWPKEFCRLGENIGIARLYGGVHWRSDHDLGRQVGQAVARLVIRQLNESGIPRLADIINMPPPPQQVQEEARDFAAGCGSGREDFCAGIVPKAPAGPVLQNIQ
jgi:membrane-associated phospholipid phosphatase